MQKIRTVKPDLFRHECLFDAEKESQMPLRFAFIGLFTCCDREGRFRWRPKQLKLDIFPYDNDIDMARVLDALFTRGFIVQYAYQGEIYGCIPSWHKHQCVNHRESASALPGLEDDIDVITDEKNDEKIDASSTCAPRVSDAIEADLGIPGGKWNWKWKGNGTGKGNGKGNGREMTCVTRQSHDDDPLAQIFAHWQMVMELPKAICDNKRKETIRRALAMGYTPSQLCNAITGCRNTPHNMGRNDKGERYNGLQVIFRDADQIDRFIRNFTHPPAPLSSTPAVKRMQSNRDHLQQWLDKKMAQAQDTHHATVEEEDHDI